MKHFDGQRRATLLGRSAWGAIALMLGTPAAAQTAEPETAQERPTDTAGDPGADAPQEIVVTGSRIRGIEPTGSNVIALDQERIEEEPVNSTNDLLRRVPQVVSLGANRAGGLAQNGAANATRGAGINLRGLSTNATLLLYDGRRFPPQGTQGQFTDPSVIPSIALARVEVVADGASAIYGSDAVAGVVNFILRKDFTGFEARARYGFTDGDYDEKQIAAIGGVQWNGGYATLAAEYTDFSTLYGRELDFYRTDNRDRGGRDLRSNFCNPGTITVGGTSYAIPEGGVTPATAGALVPGTRNLCDYTDNTAVIPEQERLSFVGNISQEVTDGIRLFANGFWSHREGVIPTEGTFTATVPSTNPFFVSPVAGASSVLVSYSLTPEIGYLENPYYAESYNVVGGVEADLFFGFRATAYYAYGESDEVAQRTRGISAGAIAAALADTNPATALNVFGGPNNPATLEAITDRAFYITGRTRLEVANVTMDGSLFDIPGGAVRLAVGGEHRVEYTYTDLAIGSSAALMHVTDDGSRNVDAVFGELFVPIVGAGNASPGLERLSLSAALRYENYSDFGDTTNPKIGLTYEPWLGLRLKGTYGTSFRAPTFTEVSTVGGGAGLYFDTLPGASGNQIGIGIAGGNPDLRPETAETWSFGVEAAPLVLPGLNASVNYFRIDYTDQIQALRGTPGLLTNPLYADFVQFNPTAAEIDALINSGLPINAPINPAQVTFIADGRRQNLGTSLLRGLDFSLAYAWEWGGVNLDAGIQGTYILDYLFEAVPGAGYTDVLDDYGFTQKFRSQASVGARWESLRGRLTWNHLPGYDNVTVTPVQEIGNYDTFDLFLGYDVTRLLSLSVDVRNLFDEDPPFVDTTNGYDPQASNPLPRLISVSASVKF
ncbi:TonB-dependent receptor plug domain-containing protein [Sphingosinithalassobacter sp. CS137]|uniref:TonB-dependent receptor plug domain-containing protein n=1 Tax=Sphingosinithalassobacter sp. CS137 TaxID=2762748 RepID=UPI0021D1D0B7|nr:TonB-dependent receptor [Sphingosinithalassobacter sp. CS137]